MPKGKPSKTTRQRYLYFQRTLHRKQPTQSLPEQLSQLPKTQPLKTLSSNILSSDDDLSLLREKNEQLQNEVHFCKQQQLILQKQLMQQEDLKQQLKEYVSSLTWEQKMRNQDHEIYEKTVSRLRETHYNNMQHWKALIAQKDQKIIELEGQVQRLEEENI